MAWITGPQLAAFHGCPDCEPATAQAAADAACDFIEKWCNRTFEAADYREWLRRRQLGSHAMILSQAPIIALYRVTTGTKNGLTLTNGSVDANDAVATVTAGSMHLIVLGGVNVHSDTLTLSTYPTMALLLAAIVALGKGWGGSVNNESVPADIHPTNRGSALSLSVTFELPDKGVPADPIDEKAGLIYLDDAWPCDPNDVFVFYRAGYAAIPDALEQLTYRLGCDLIRTATTDTTMQSEKLDRYSWTRRADVGDLVSAYRRELQPWKREFLC